MQFLNFCHLTIFLLIVNLFERAFTAEWCYDDEDGCGPNTKAWPKLCHKGKHQSPINLPQITFSSGMTTLRLLQSYQGNHFRMQNNGHTIYLDFTNDDGSIDGPTSKPFPFPDASKALGWDQNNQNTKQYKFASVHMHWGRNISEGTEHCFDGACYSMEIHFVHYLATFESFEAARDSGDDNALAVLGVLVDSNPVQGAPPSSLGPIARNLAKVEDSSAGIVKVEESLDFTQLLLSENQQINTYKGSLTSPDCQEVVNWYVLRRPAVVPKSELDAFRSLLKDGRGKVMDHNWRPIQNRNNRDVFLTSVNPSQ